MKMKFIWMALTGVLLAAQLHAQTVVASNSAERRDVYVSRVVEHPRAVLVLCPGQNRNGRDLLEQEEWKRFAKENHLVLAALSYASDDSTLRNGGGYFNAARGSGEILLQTIRKECGENLPLLMYGFSGGAHFVNSFINWKPGSVLSFCAYSAGWWEPPIADKKVPPGIIACGADDAGNYAATLRYFSQGRAGGREWTWVSLGNTGHQISQPLDEFVRTYFSVILEQRNDKKRGEWRDNDTKELLTATKAIKEPTLATWLPDASLVQPWTSLHQP